MKIAILSDINGNIVALDAVLRDTKENNVNAYIIAGDIILDFPFPNEVINAIRALTPTPYVIKGNREKYLEKYENDKANSTWNTMQMITIKDNCNELSSDNKEYIMNLPEQLSINLNGLKIKVVHGSPYGISQMVDFNNNNELDKITNEMSEDVLVCGHTHAIANYIKHNDKIIINDGTVGMNVLTKYAQYIILNYENGDIDITQRNVDYDKNKLKELIKSSPIFFNSYVWTNLCYCNIMTGKDIRGQFTDEGIEKMNIKYNREEINKSVKFRYSKFNVIDDDIYKELSNKYKSYFFIA